MTVEVVAKQFRAGWRSHRRMANDLHGRGVVMLAGTEILLAGKK
jgi:hypothetical protein